MNPETYRIAFSRPEEWSLPSLLRRAFRVCRIAIGVVFFSLCVLFIVPLVEGIIQSRSFIGAFFGILGAAFFALAALIIGRSFIWSGVGRRVSAPQQAVRSARLCCSVCILLSVLLLSTDVMCFYRQQWGPAFLLLPGIVFHGAIACLLLKRPNRRAANPGGGFGGSGRSGAGKPAPLQPAPSHHLQAAKSFPPSDTTHSWLKD